MPESADILIIGGGVLGAALAYEFSRRTIRCTLLEAGAVGSGVSSTSFGWVNGTSKWQNPEYLALNATGLALLDKLAYEHSAEAIGLQEGGSLIIGTGAEATRVRSQRMELQKARHTAFTLTASEAKLLEPNLQIDENAEILFAPGDRILDAPRFCRFLADQSRKLKADIREYEAAVSITRSSITGKFIVETKSATILAGRLILAAGHSTRTMLAEIDSGIAADALQLQASPGMLITLSGDGISAAAHRVIYPGGGLHIRPAPGGRMMVASEEADRKLLLDPFAKPEELAEQTVFHIAEKFPALKEKLREATREIIVANRVMPVDEVPVCGEVKAIPGLYLCVAHSGITLSLILAKALADGMALISSTS